jgi:radical SAM-linked protein
VYNINRSGIKIKYSQGFNPHPAVFFAPPLAIGISSVSEYCAIDCDCEPELFKKSFNKFAVGGIRCLKCFYADKNPNLQAAVRFAEYEIYFEDIKKYEKEITALLKEEKIEINVSHDDKATKKDVKSLIKSFRFENKKLKLILSCGNLNLRPDRLMGYIVERLGLKAFVRITRINMFIEKDGSLLNIETIF